MSQSGGAAQVISLPKGGGALQGIGEKFAPDLHTGTGNFTVPIALPPGRNGFQPQVNLGYSTGNSNGPFGLGCALSVPGVTRKTSKGVPRYRDGSENPEEWDTFILSGAEDLVPVPGGPSGAQRYRPRTEGLFAHIDRYHHPSEGDSHYCPHANPGSATTTSTKTALSQQAQLKTAYTKYQNDPNVAFLLVSIDEDTKRLQRYLDEMKCSFPVARVAAAAAEQAMGIRQHPGHVLRRPGRRRSVPDRRQRIARRFAGTRRLVHRSAQESLT